MDAFELLKADHKKVAELFDKLEAATGKAKLAVFAQINDELELHTHIEETIFYPALETPEETHDLTLEAYEEHNVVKSLLKELSGAQSADDEWQAQAKVLRENVEHHVDEEEGELFDKADDALSDERIEQLGRQMEAEKARKQGKPAPKPAAASKSANAAAKSNEAKPGILSKIASLVGLGDASKKKGASKKRQTPKGASTSSKTSKKSKATKAAKPTKASKSRKSSATTASKRLTAAQGAKRIPTKSSKAKRGGTTKKSGKKKSGRR